IPATRRALLRLRDSDGWMHGRPDWGRGRIDPFNPVKYTTLRQPIDSTIGNSDMVPLWNLQQHQGYAFHWDGLNTSLQEVVLSSAIGDGATTKWVDRDFRKWNNTRPEEMSSLRRIQNYISRVQAPKYPFPIDSGLAASGAPIFARECGACHAPGAARGRPPWSGRGAPYVPRPEMWPPASATAYNAYGQGHAWKFSAFRTTGGYVSVPLEGLWLRAPYLHNGSVPSLADLLEKP